MIERSVVSHETRLPGYDAHQSVRLAPDADEQPFIQSQAAYAHLRDHHEYLNDEVYDKYLRMHKVLVGESGAYELIEIADTLMRSELPRYLDAAGWAYAEAGLALKSESTLGRVELVMAAESCWERSLQMEQFLLDDRAPQHLFEDAASYRTAMNLAYAPLMKSIIIGNVADGTRERVFADTLAIAQTSALQLGFATREDNMSAASGHVGFIHEANTLLTLLYLDDPRYVPLPSSARADTGYYYQHQTHDVTIINQHWGNIKKVIPMEVKARASARDRERYKALIVRGKMHLMVAGRNDPRETTEAFSNVYHGVADESDKYIVDHASSTVLDLLRLYQRGAANAVGNVTSQTKFHDAQYVAPYYQQLTS